MASNPYMGTALILGHASGVRTAVKLDPSTSSIQTVNYAHHEVHSGSHYYLEGFTTLADEGTFYVKLVTPDTTKWSHFRWQIEASGILETYLYEDATGGMTGGGLASALNSNRNSSNTSGMVITSDVATNTGQGAIVSQHKVGGSGFKTVSGGSVDRTDEIILKQDTVYCRKFLSGSADNVVSFRASWYEHANNA